MDAQLNPVPLNEGGMIIERKQPDGRRINVEFAGPQTVKNQPKTFAGQQSNTISGQITSALYEEYGKDKK